MRDDGGAALAASLVEAKVRAAVQAGAPRRTVAAAAAAVASVMAATRCGVGPAQGAPDPAAAGSAGSRRQRRRLKKKTMMCRSGQDAVLGEPVGQTLKTQRVDHEVAHVGSHVPVPAQTAADVKMSELEKENEDVEIRGRSEVVPVSVDPGVLKEELHDEELQGEELQNEELQKADHDVDHDISCYHRSSGDHGASDFHVGSSSSRRVQFDDRPSVVSYEIPLQARLRPISRRPKKKTMSCRSGHDAVLGEPVGQTLKTQRVDHEVAHVGSHVPVPAQTAADVEMSEWRRRTRMWRFVEDRKWFLFLLIQVF
ncbi:unnamed protein product [Prorocentrum cordatum]|uniref:Uncharacterized protein n=1 Tax=Prorocentrum cordatum TaxID=2364126 RepID=A0ABN9W885_9DINO|nr:unnamed protein product [Polarella glacialis]